jgi:hypothetical protein
MALAAPSVERPGAGFISRLLRLGPGEVGLLPEAIVLLALSSIVIRVFSFVRVGRLASAPLRRRPPVTREALSAKVAWAVQACARRAPFRAVCFQQGLATQIMLRRRGVDSTLYFGAGPDDAKGLTAHVWVRDGERDVIGCEEASRFAVLAQFPPAQLPI